MYNSTLISLLIGAQLPGINLAVRHINPRNTVKGIRHRTKSPQADLDEARNSYQPTRHVMLNLAITNYQDLCFL